MPLTVCYNELDSWAFADAIVNPYSVLAINDTYGWMDAESPAILLTAVVTDAWSWTDNSTVNTPFDQIADKWRFGDSLNTVTSTQLYDYFAWGDETLVVATGAAVDQWRWSDTSAAFDVTASSADQWRWQDTVTYGATASTLDPFGWADALSSPQTSGVLADAWRWADDGTAGLSSTVLLDSWRWQDNASLPVMSTGIADAWHWGDSSTPIKITSVGSLIDELFWADSPVVSNANKAWVSHLRTFYASVWHDLPYSSAAGGLMAGGSGIYKNGAQKANATLVTGKLDFGDVSQKHLSHAYVGMLGATTMRLGVKTDNQPIYEYAGESHSTGNARFVCGRGLRGRHFQLTLTVDSSVTDITVETNTTSRRLR